MFPFAALSSEESAAGLLKQVHWRDGIQCPRCRSSSLIKYGSYRVFQGYLCKDCDRTFNDKTRTIFALVIKESYEDSGVIYRKFYRKVVLLTNMPPDGYTTVTISDSLATKLAQIMARHDCSSYAEAIEYAADTTLIQEDEITVQELIQLLAERLDEVNETSLP